MGLLTRFIVSSGEDVLSSLFCAILQFASTMLFNRYGATALTSFLCFFFIYVNNAQRLECILAQLKGDAP